MLSIYQIEEIQDSHTDCQEEAKSRTESVYLIAVWTELEDFSFVKFESDWVSVKIVAKMDENLSTLGIFCNRDA